MSLELEWEFTEENGGEKAGEERPEKDVEKCRIDMIDKPTRIKSQELNFIDIVGQESGKFQKYFWSFLISQEVEELIFRI